VCTDAGGRPAQKGICCRKHGRRTNRARAPTKRGSPWTRTPKEVALAYGRKEPVTSHEENGAFATPHGKRITNRGKKRSYRAALKAVHDAHWC